jgi:hypothetical protein
MLCLNQVTRLEILVFYFMDRAIEILCSIVARPADRHSDGCHSLLQFQLFAAALAQTFFGMRALIYLCACRIVNSLVNLSTYQPLF